MKHQEAALVCFSGGQDSTTCLFWAKKHFSRVEAVCFTYGQKHSLEIEVARKNCSRCRRSVPIVGRIVDQPARSELFADKYRHLNGSGKTGRQLPEHLRPGTQHGIPDLRRHPRTQQRIFHLVTGVSEADFSGYPDCRDTFVRSLNVTLNLAMDEQFVIHTPLMDRDKSEVWELSDTLGVFDLVRTQTLTCYNGIMAEGCGHCPACTLRREGWRTI